MIAPARSWLYVPAHRPELLAKAMAGAADAVIYDLEDAVPADAKDVARANAVAAAATTAAKPLWVRINAPGSPSHEADVAALAGSGATGICVAKATDPADVVAAAERLALPLHLLIETALGVENAYALATCHPRVASMSLGEADLAADLRVRDPATLDWARQRVVTACRAADLPSPPHAVWTDIRDVDGLIADTEAASDRGFFGRTVIHPAQVEPVNTIFTPDAGEVARAQALLDSLRAHDEGGSTAWLDDHGRFIDPAVVARGRWVLDLAAQLEGRSDA